MYKMFLDDIRDPPDETWVVVRSYQSAIDHIRVNGMPYFISFDHDLGDGPTGYDLVKWIVEMDLDLDIKIPVNFQFSVHSANPIGKKNIHFLLTNYLETRYRTS